MTINHPVHFQMKSSSHSKGVYGENGHVKLIVKKRHSAKDHKTFIIHEHLVYDNEQIIRMMSSDWPMHELKALIYTMQNTDKSITLYNSSLLNVLVLGRLQVHSSVKKSYDFTLSHINITTACEA